MFMAQVALGALIQIAEKLQHLYNEFIMKIYYTFKFIFFKILEGLGTFIVLTLGRFVKLVFPIAKWIPW